MLKKYGLVIGLLLLLVTTIAVYYRVLSFDYINYDDGSFQAAPGVMSFDLLSLFTQARAFDYIPLTLSTFALEYVAFGFIPAVSHGINLVIHLINIILLFLIVRRWFVRPWITLLILCLFALHPLNVESVAWVAERKGLLSAMFVFLSTLIYLRWLDSQQKKFLAFSLILYIAAVLSKPVALPLPLLACAYEIHRKNWKNLRALGLISIPMIIFAIAHIAARNSLSALEVQDGKDLVVRIPAGIAFYVISFFSPQYLSAFYTQVSVAPVFAQAIYALAALVACSTLVFLKGGKKLYFVLGLVVYALFILPQTKVLPYGLNFLYADRYFYLAGVGLIVALCSVLDVSITSSKYETYWLKSIHLALIVLLLTPLSKTWQRIEVWKNSETLWRSALSRDQANAVAHNNLGSYYFQLNRFDEAEGSFASAVHSDPRFVKPIINLAAVAERRNDLPAAKKYLEQALALDPQNQEVLAAYRALGF